MMQLAELKSEVGRRSGHQLVGRSQKHEKQYLVPKHIVSCHDILVYADYYMITASKTECC